MRDFRELDVWNEAHQFVLSIYELSGTFPNEERYGLTSQIRRASASITSNIAEGCGRDTDKDLARFLQMSAGSVSEVENQLILALDLDYIDKSSFDELNQSLQSIKRMLNSFIQSLRSDN